MKEFTLAMVVFLSAHSLPNALGVRTRLIRQFGRKAYMISYSILSIGLLIWLIKAALAAPYIEVWQPTAATAAVPVIAMLLASILFASAVLQPNPLSISIVSRPIISRPIISGNGILLLLRHPLLWALFLWAASHAIANGDIVSLSLFGGLALFSLVGMKIMEQRAKRALPPDKFSEAMALTHGPWKARLAKLSARRLWIETAAGVILYTALLYAHEPIIGIDPLAFVVP